jgi:CCR4-NOT transcription complex subunit 1
MKGEETMGELGSRTKTDVAFSSFTSSLDGVKQKPWSPLHTELLARLLSTFLSGHPSHQLVFLRLFQLVPSFLLAALRDYYAESEMNVTRILDIAQDLKALDWVLEELRGGGAGASAGLALDLAALASRREYLNLDKWLTQQIKQQGGQLVRATLEFVGHKVQHELRRQEGAAEGAGQGGEPTTLALNAATIAVFMRVLRAQCVPSFFLCLLRARRKRY